MTHEPPASRPSQQRPTLDAFEFARLGSRAEGQAPVAALPRLAASLRDAPGARDAVTWSLRGSTGAVQRGGRASWLDLTLDFDAPLECGRCLDTVVLARHVERRFKLEQDAAAVEDDPLDEDEWDALLGSRTFDVLGLVEDEALLALPYAPVHADCGLPASPGLDDAARGAPAPARENPFAVLAALRSAKGEERGGPK